MNFEACSYRYDISNCGKTSPTDYMAFSISQSAIKNWKTGMNISISIKGKKELLYYFECDSNHEYKSAKTSGSIGPNAVFHFDDG